ncbi:PolC-type DNA polymerase III [Allomuricauda sp. SCSIO 65647]|uniref:3'-5' exonuclease n=1 Tax=Allomuricauda sp. SCSIO 65647 TaxID=2908843 RepID=UPI001F2909AF|nr:3'-5' exonuclease [Muricauda sp. SCSIO 65647]UJH67075.1 3'-5' exonuclease [Muricauda sp. SCSIO 65647]
MAKQKNTYPKFWKTYADTFERALPDEIEEVDFVVLDTETTGFDFKKDRILSIGALKISNGTISPKTSFELFLQQETFDSKTVQIHGILKKTKIEQIGELEALKTTLKLLERSVLVAHHVAFDVRMLNEALKRNGLPRLKNPELDTSVLYNKSLAKSKRKKEGHYSLDELANTFNIPKTDRHTALGDAYITAIAFLHIMEKLKPVSLKQLLKKDRFGWLWNSF